MSPLSSRIIKGGALLEDSRRLLDVWDPAASSEENLAKISGGRLGKTGSRAQDVLEILKQRFLSPGPEVARTLRRLMDDSRAFREACYYEAARADELLRAFAQGPFYEWYEDGRVGIESADVVRWLMSDARVPRWSERTSDRVAQGLISALRDFGLLEGVRRGRRKQYVPPQVSMRGFAYVAIRERRSLPSAKALLEARVWRRYLLSPSDVRRLFLEADRLHVLRFSEAGTVIRIDWLIDDLEDVPNVLAA